MLLLIIFFFSTPSLTQYTCLPNYSWNNALHSCYPNNVSCQRNYQWNGTMCIPSIICPDLTFFSGDNCITVAYGCPLSFYKYKDTCINCPQGFTLNINNFTCFWTNRACQSNYYWNGNTCIQYVTSNFNSMPQQINNLSAGIIQINNTANQASSIRIQNNNQIGLYQLSTNSSINNLRQNCQINFTWDGEACVSHSTPGTIIRISNKSIINSQDPSNKTVKWTLITDIECTSDYYFNGRNCSQRSLGIRCQPGYAYNITACVNASLIAHLIGTTEEQPRVSLSPSMISNVTNVTNITTVKSNTVETIPFITPISPVANINLSLVQNPLIATSSVIPSTPLNILSNTTTTTSYVSVPQLYQSFDNNTNFLSSNNNSSTFSNNITTNTTLLNNVNTSSIHEGSCPTGYTWNGILCQNQSQSKIQSNTTTATFSTFMVPTQGVVMIPHIPQCQRGFFFNGQICTPLPPMYNCTGGFIWDGVSCVEYTGNKSKNNLNDTNNSSNSHNSSNQSNSSTQINSSISSSKQLNQINNKQNQQTNNSIIPNTTVTTTTTTTISNFSEMLNSNVQLLNSANQIKNCSPGYRWVKQNQCVPINCLQNQIYNGTHCLCSDGYIWNNNKTYCIKNNEQPQNTTTINRNITTTSNYNNSNNINTQTNITYVQSYNQTNNQSSNQNNQRKQIPSQSNLSLMSSTKPQQILSSQSNPQTIITNTTTTRTITYEIPQTHALSVGEVNVTNTLNNRSIINNSLNTLNSIQSNISYPIMNNTIAKSNSNTIIQNLNQTKNNNLSNTNLISNTNSNNLFIVPNNQIVSSVVQQQQKPTIQSNILPQSNFLLNSNQQNITNNNQQIYSSNQQYNPSRIVQTTVTTTTIYNNQLNNQISNSQSNLQTQPNQELIFKPLTFITPSTNINSNSNINSHNNTSTNSPTRTVNTNIGGWNQCNDVQYWNGIQCVQYKGLMTCHTGYYWNWSTSRCS